MKRTFNAKEVAEKLGVNERTISRHIDQGRLKAARPGKNYIITREALEQYLGSKEMVDEIFGPVE